VQHEDPISTVFPRPRRTQQERRETTRAALLEATIASLVELGYSGATTLDVERRAGVSRGARIHHFPTKALLLAGAVDYLYERLGDHYEQAFGRTGEDALDGERLSSGLMVLWSVYSRPEYAAALELNMAARTDAELRERLQEVVERHRLLAVQAAAKYFPSLPRNTAEILIEVIHAALVGLRMGRNVMNDPVRDQAVLSTLQRTVVSHLPQAHSTPQTSDTPEGARRR